MKELINIHTREVAGRNVDADEGYKIGLKIIESMTGIDTDKFIFKKKDRDVIMKSESSIKTDNEEIFVDPMLLFQRLIASVQGISCDVDVETAFSYELCIFPLALSENNGYLRETDKPQLANAIWKFIGNCVHHVLDEGSLLHKVTLKRGMTYDLRMRFAKDTLTMLKNAMDKTPVLCLIDTVAMHLLKISFTCIVQKGN